MKTRDELRFKEFNVGVIVGRFQVPELHRMHHDLIQSVIDLSLIHISEPTRRRGISYAGLCL